MPASTSEMQKIKILLLIPFRFPHSIHFNLIHGPLNQFFTPPSEPSAPPSNAEKISADDTLCERMSS